MWTRVSSMSISTNLEVFDDEVTRWKMDPERFRFRSCAERSERLGTGNGPIETPEMDPGLVTSAIALVSGGLLLIAGRKRIR